MTDLSLGELEALATKAARGAGMPWGLAAEAGHSVRVLAGAGAPGGARLAGLLTSYGQVARPRRDKGVWRGDGALCPVTLGAALADFAEPARTGPVAAPALLAGGIARLADLRPTLEWAGGVIWASPNGLGCSGKLDALVADEAELTLGTAPAQITRARTRANVSDEVLSILNRFAHKTYAPATEASRLAGAGAGLTDND